jgi:hypothetical protein
LSVIGLILDYHRRRSAPAARAPVAPKQLSRLSLITDGGSVARGGKLDRVGENDF